MTASETLSFSDAFGAALQGGDYTLTVTHTVAPGASNAQTLTSSQPFTVLAPEFTIDPAIVVSTHPQSGGNAGNGYCVIPHIVLGDEGLPWERPIVPGNSTTPWLALIVFADGEVQAPVTTKVSDLLALQQGGSTIGPAIDPGTILPSLLDSKCQTITISGATFNDVMPALAEVPLLAHCQSIDSTAEGTGNASVLFANRLPVDPSSNTPMQYYAHLVSLEGFAANLAPATSPIAGSANVQLVTLYNWPFIALPETPLNFETIAAALAANAGPLALTPDDPGANQEVTNRLHDGYAPLTYVTISGDETFAWYRGPLSPVDVPSLPVDASNATSSDALTIYSEAYGLFDLSYAAAWNFGRARALADAHFAQSFQNAQKTILRTAATLAQKMAMPCLEGLGTSELLANDVARRTFLRGVAGAAPAHGSDRRGRLSPHRRKRYVHPRLLLARPEVREAVAADGATAPILAWLTNLMNLVPVPFSYLVPDPAMLPVESVRFFRIDPNWIDALIAGATSIALQGAGSLAASAIIREQFLATAVYPAAGMLVRSQLISGWPTLVITATSGGTVNVLRDDTLATNVRLALFDQLPDSVTLGEPYHGLQLGMDLDTSGNLTVQPRSLSGSSIGMPTGASPVTPTFRDATTRVLDIGQLATNLSTTAPRDFGLQLIRVPYQLTFSN
jgi:hypothetical protein